MYGIVQVMKNVRLFSRFALFVIYFWFGILKVFDLSPATPLVNALAQKSFVILPDFLQIFLSPSRFIILFGLIEVLIGILFLFPALTKPTKIIFGLHMITTFLPLFLLPSLVWQSLLVPTLEGQYIIKNLALIAIVLHL
ncbi:hypothetical protein KW782_01475 [Candidatus Parcubacteria bacterium]|nr:hypothetical protein [Candidatus Parcubacteria bacterium]